MTCNYVGTGTHVNQVANRLGTEKFCSDCGGNINAKAEICPKCGVRQMAPQYYAAYPPPGYKSKVAAGVLAILLGGLGIHKFYLNRPGQGILYLLFFWTCIPAIVGFIEGIIYLTMSDQAFAAKYH